MQAKYHQVMCEGLTAAIPLTKTGLGNRKDVRSLDKFRKVLQH